MLSINYLGILILLFLGIRLNIISIAVKPKALFSIIIIR